MTLVDHVFAVLLVVGLPAYAAWKLPEMVRKLEAGVPGARASEYWWTLVIQWLLTIALVASWFLAGRPLISLGLAWPPTTATAGGTVLLCAAVVAFFAQQARAVSRSAEARAQLLAQLDAQPAARALIPRTTTEARIFVALALTAGICEEVLYRGYLLWYFDVFLDRGPAALAAIVVFGAAHAYQGVRGVLLTGIVGGISMAAYLATGSLVASIILHATIDLANGRMARVALTDPPPSSSSR